MDMPLTCRCTLMLAAFLMMACGESAPPADGGSTTPDARSPDPTAPPPSAGHDLVYHDALGAVLLVNAGLGGHNDAQMTGQPTRLWRWDGTRWSLLDASGPPVRNLGGVAYDARRDKLILHGGTFSASLSYGDTWEWDLQGGWRRFEVPGPGTRDHTQMTYDAERGVAVLFGGQASLASFPVGTWEWDGSHWTEVATVGPSPRVHHAMTYEPASRRTVLFGGAASGSNPLGDTWAWDGRAWTELTGATAARTHARLAFHAQLGHLLLIGGMETQGLARNYLGWDGAAWRSESFAQPPPRYLTGVAYDRSRQRLVMFGGGGTGDALLADTWEFDGVTWARIP
jgi:hypothetical protein